MKTRTKIQTFARASLFLVMLAGGCLRDAYDQTVALSVADDEVNTSSDSDASTSTSDASTGTDNGTETSSTSTETGSATTDLPPTCGNGQLDQGEECDDGNFSNGDACLDTCAIARCGDGHVYDGFEECDDGNDDNTDACSNECTLAVCGDGILQEQLGEECDDSEDETCNACHRDRLVFTTSSYTTGALGGLSGADYFCQMHADEAGIGGERKYMAWLSLPGITPKTRFYKTPGRYLRTDGVVLAWSFDDVIDGLLDAIPSHDEHGELLGDPGAWTNTDEFGEWISDEDHCDGWTTNDVMAGFKGRWGSASALDKWSDYGDSPVNPILCGSSRHMYCFEQ